MRRSTAITLVLSLTILAGCGGSNPPPSASPAPAYMPPAAAQPAEQPVDQPQAATTETEQPRESVDEASQGQNSSLTTTEEMPAEEKDGLGDEVPTKDEPAATETNEEKKGVENQADSESDAATAIEPSAPRRRSGKLLRRLGSSFGRALAKATTNVESPSPPRPAPNLADDPFPNGEPADEKSKK